MASPRKGNFSSKVSLKLFYNSFLLVLKIPQRITDYFERLVCPRVVSYSLLHLTSHSALSSKITLFSKHPPLLLQNHRNMHSFRFCFNLLKIRMHFQHRELGTVGTLRAGTVLGEERQVGSSRCPGIWFQSCDSSAPNPAHTHKSEFCCCHLLLGQLS